MLAADRKKRHNFCYSQKLRPFLRQLKQALCLQLGCLSEIFE